MIRTFGMISATALLAALLCSSARALPVPKEGIGSGESNITRVWDNCGVGRHRTRWGQCVSNYAIGPGMRGCPPGYHLGNSVHGCFPNR
jgi:hypothetical protein